MELLNPIFKWLHIIAGITWIGLLYFFNFINGHLAATYDADTKKKVVPELMPRALYWFRWGAAWTWFTGIVLLYLIYLQGGTLMPNDFTSGEDPIKGNYSANMLIHISLTIAFLTVFLYDFFYKSSLGKNTRVATIISFAYIAGFIYFMTSIVPMASAFYVPEVNNSELEIGYRTFNILIGTMFGTIMAFNVWFRIWPAQQRIITAIKGGEAPNADDVGMAGLRSKHNTYMSIPLIWTMINEHHFILADGGGKALFGIPQELWLIGMVALGWHIVFQLYRKSGKVKGF